MKIVWFTWKDIKHPFAGGAENVSWQLARDLVKHGHEVHILTARYPGSAAHETLEGVEISRQGGHLSVYGQSRRFFRRQLAGWPDLVIDEMNTLPFGAAFITRKPTVLLTYQLAREVWFYQAPFPLSIIGYLLEPLYLFALSLRYKQVVTESESTRQDLSRYGFKQQRVGVFRVGIELAPVAKLPAKKELNDILVLGAIRPMKRTLSAVRGFEYARDTNPNLKLTLAGDNHGAYAEKVQDYIKASRHAEAIKVLGRVSKDEKLHLMRQATAIIVTSVKEGWGLIVTEANSQGTPAIAYDCDGLRDSVGQTGRLVPNNNESALGQAIVDLTSDPVAYQKLRQAAWQNSKQYTFANSYADFTKLLGIN